MHTPVHVRIHHRQHKVHPDIVGLRLLVGAVPHVHLHSAVQHILRHITFSRTVFQRFQCGEPFAAILRYLCHIVGGCTYVANVEPPEPVAAPKKVLIAVAVAQCAVFQAAEYQASHVVRPSVLLHHHTAPGLVERGTGLVAPIVVVLCHPHVYLAAFPHLAPVIGHSHLHLRLQASFGHIETPRQQHTVRLVLVVHRHHIIA